ncbi:intradiol ring-cleavage dioxygenase [Salegentibacter sp. JZCK2]|uniref:intradiol ring-cleavage dioxygenase n=1 Tax=Salegentibacter tibetensis TaxID=2873600 RepID=UPI001CCE4357|nr:intradiol ring-cleavage dioxygenase [Salegentibacter tibetensis]MBZ9731444.1 intradiol ring-cleavage dioxygenase [Salegentibacter tibetensis]
MKKYLIILIFVPFVETCIGQNNVGSENSQLVGAPCEGCEAVFEYGDKNFKPVDTLPDYEKYDPKLKVTGVIYQSDGKTPAKDVILYLYHTNPEGKYPKKGDETGWARRHGYVRGWIKTGKDGEYTFYTHMPGSYGSNPAHLHPTILEPDGKYYYIDEYHFKSDPLLSENKNFPHRGGDGVVTLQKAEGGGFLVERDIILGLNVPDYN